MTADAPAPAAGYDLAQLAQINRQASAAGVEAADQPLLPPRVQSTGTLRRLYEAALVLFAQRGFHAVSVRDVARDVGVQASSLYAHVPSKQHLLADLVRFGHEEHRDALRLALLESGAEPADQLSALMRAHVRVHATYPLLTRVSNRELAALPDDRQAEIVAIRLESERLFLDVIERGKRLGAFGVADPLLAVAAIGAMGIRVAEWWHPRLGIAIEDIAQTYAGFAVRLVG
jgi:AcrR family transcriptional regulator